MYLSQPKAAVLHIEKKILYLKLNSAVCACFFIADGSYTLGISFLRLQRMKKFSELCIFYQTEKCAYSKMIRSIYILLFLIFTHSFMFSL